eukprot:scaffold55517_cov63-Phaeocystis_antarctica.AAC.5
MMRTRRGSWFSPHLRAKSAPVAGWPLTRQLTRALLRLNSPLRGCSALRRQNLVLPLLSSHFRPIRVRGSGRWHGLLVGSAAAEAADK